MTEDHASDALLRRRSWYTAAEPAAVQVVPTGLEDGRYLVVVAGDLLGTVGPARAGGGPGAAPLWHLEPRRR
ncbi:hypothetical protein ACBJ59_50430 [Nonomuraea sp. MTCD27]|uniref:hypothetical protein n=1 Tax=Nonomuraea sp. MTCD27 TaxID=1676747 RepID=UPI0035C19C21